MFDAAVEHPDDPPAMRPAADVSGADRGWWAQARSTDPDVEPVTFDPSGFYSDAQIAAVADALDAGDPKRAQELQDRPWLAQGATVDTAHFHVADDRIARSESVAWTAMPEWMRRQAHDTEAEIATATYVPGPPDDLGRFVARLDALRAQKAESEAVRGEDPRGYAETVGDAAAVLRAARSSTDDATARREQLARWRTDDEDVHGDHLGGEDIDAGVGRAHAMDDGPGLP